MVIQNKFENAAQLTLVKFLRHSALLCMVVCNATFTVSKNKKLAVAVQSKFCNCAV